MLDANAGRRAEVSLVKVLARHGEFPILPVGRVKITPTCTEVQALLLKTWQVDDKRVAATLRRHSAMESAELMAI